MSYEPKPDTVAFRALAHMELLHKGSEISNAVLGVALGVDSKVLQPSLKPAVEAGLIFCRQKGGHSRSPVFWSLVDQSNKNGKGYTEGRGSQHVLKAEPATADATDRDASADASPSVGSMGAGKAADAAPLTLRQEIAAAGGDRIEISPRLKRAYRRAPRETSLPQPPDRPEEILVGGEAPVGTRLANGLRAALWSDGTLEIHRAAVPAVVFTRDEARALVDYLNAIDLAVLEVGEAE